MKPTTLLYGSLHTVIKLFAIAFTCVYLHLSVGVVKTTHYCMGRESSSTLYSFKAKRCACSLFLSNLEKKSCCHDESEVIVLEDDQTATTSLTLHAPDYYQIAEVHSTNLMEQLFFDEVSTHLILDDFPPPKEPLYKIYCRYTLYEEALVA